MKRNPDGTFRNARQAVVVSDRFARARWVVAEILLCKRTGLSMAAIAAHIGRVGRDEEKSSVELPSGIVFPPDYRISESAVYKAYIKVMNLRPAAEIEILRKEDTDRCEQLYVHLQRGIGSGDPRAIDSAV